jgi:hypothetical protein
MYVINEMMHGLTAQIGAVSARSAQSTYTPEQFCDSMFSKARFGGFEAEFDVEVMSRVLRYFLEP